MSARIPLDRPGYAGYACDPEGVSKYELACMCCHCLVNPTCVVEYLNIPTNMRGSNIGMPWDESHSSLVRAHATEPNRWLVTEPSDTVTPPTCGDDVGEAYQYLTTDYIDVPPIQVRGLSKRSDAATSKPTCQQCYEVDYEDEDRMIIDKVYWTARSGGKQEVLPDFNLPMSTYPPTTVDIADVDSSKYTACTGSGSSGYSKITFSYCPPPWNLTPDDLCDGDPFLAVEDLGFGGRRLYWDYESIPGYSDTGKYGLIIEEGCPKWLLMEECPEDS